MLVLHNLIPHEHHDELSGEEHEIQHKEAESFLELLKLVFHEDMGEGHLEHVVVSSTQLPNVSFLSPDIFIPGTVIFSEILQGVAKESNLETTYKYQSPFSDRFYEHQNELRGPPFSA